MLAWMMAVYILIFIFLYGLFVYHVFTNFLFECCCLQSHPLHRSSLYFHDGIRTVDFILVWDDHVKHANSEASRKKRKIFEKNLQCEG
jgi:hypothetical protein